MRKSKSHQCLTDDNADLTCFELRYDNEEKKYCVYTDKLGLDIIVALLEKHSFENDDFYLHGSASTEAH